MFCLTKKLMDLMESMICSSRFRQILSALLLLHCIYACGIIEDVETQEEWIQQQDATIHQVLKKSELRILDIGNSYTNDATALLPQIVDASHVNLNDFCLYKAIRSGASLKSWCNVYHDQDPNYTYSVSKVIGNLKANVEAGTGAKGDGSLFRKVLTSEQWDLIMIHQLSTTAPYYAMWAGDNSDGSLEELLNIIKKHQPNATIGFYIIHSYWDEYENNKEQSSYGRWKLICEAVQRVQSNYKIDFIIPYGTAVENLRASSLNNEYDLTRDGTHCGYGLCRYTAACCYYEALIAPRTGISVLGNSVRYDASHMTSSIYPAISVTENNARIAQQAAVLAVQNPYKCINPE